jgi:hypothetical protein
MFQEITFEYKFSLQFTVLLSNILGITSYINYNLRQRKLPGARPSGLRGRSEHPYAETQRHRFLGLRIVTDSELKKNC